MSDERAQAVANLILREGVLKKTDPDHQQIYTELMENSALYDDVLRRLSDVGYDLVQQIGHLGVRVARELEEAEGTRNRMQLHAGHIRAIVYLWTQLVYREWNNLRRGLDDVAPGNEQASLFEEPEALDEPPSMSYRAFIDAFFETTSKSTLKGILSALRRWRFIGVDEKRDRIWADSGLYIYVDRLRMEDFVVKLARRVGTDDPGEAVEMIATGSKIAKEALEDGGDP